MTHRTVGWVLAISLGVASAMSAQPPRDVHLLRLPGDTVDVMYSPGTLDRASHVQKRLEVLAATLRDWTRYPVGATVYVLNRSDWKATQAGPYYGVPGRVMGDALAIAADGDMELAGFWQYLLGRPAPQLPGVPLTAPPEGADALAMSDLLLQLEATASMLGQAGLSASSPINNRLAVHLTAWDILALHEPERVDELDRVFTDLGRWPTRPLDDRDLTLEEWVSLEAHFFRGAQIIRQGSGKNPSKKVLRSAMDNGGVIDLEPLTGKKKLRAPLDAWSQAWVEDAGAREGSEVAEPDSPG